MVAPGFLTIEVPSARSFRLSSHREKPLLRTTRWFSQNSQFKRKTQCLTEVAQVGLSRFARQSLKTDKGTPEFPANKVIDLPVPGLFSGAGDSADGIS